MSPAPTLGRTLPYLACRPPLAARTASGALRWLLCAALPILACACSERDPQLTSTAGIVELVPELVNGSEIELAERRYLVVGMASARAEGVAEKGVQIRPLPGPGGEVADTLMVWGNEEKRIVVPGELDPLRFDHVRVGILLRISSSMRVSFLREGKVVLRSSWVPVVESDFPQHVTVPIEHDPLETEPYDAIELLLPAGLGGPVCFHQIELLHMPLAAWVLEPDGGPRLVRVGREHRLAYGVGGPIGRRALFRAEGGASLRLSYALAPELHSPGQGARLRLTMQAQGAPALVRELALERGSRDELRWHSAEVPLDALAGKDVELSIELAGSSEPAYGYVGELRVVREEERAPTVLFVTSDTHRADHLNAATPDLGIYTPALDALAARGVLFERCFSTSNHTLPSHVALMTGRHPRDTRIVDNRTPLVDHVRTLARVFQERGWRTHAAVAVNHLTPDNSGLAQGFARYSSPVSEYTLRAEEVVPRIERWIADSAGEPLFVWLHLFDAHTPYEPPEKFAQHYVDGPLHTSTDGAKLSVLDEGLRVNRARYRGEVSYLDSQLGRLLSIPRIVDGIVAVTSDHGECLGQHGLYYNHDELYPDTVHVPMILAWPGGPTGRRVQVPAQHLGLGRTLLDLAGLEEEPFPGRSMLEALEPGARGEPLFALSFAGKSASITHGTSHLVLHLVDHVVEKGAGSHRSRARHEVELYDLQQDPACEHELSRERRGEAARLRAGLVRWLAGAEELDVAAESKPEFRAALEALGYAGVTQSLEGPWIDPDCTCERCLDFR